MLPRTLLLLFVLAAAPATAQVNNDAYRDYFLVGQFGEVCTMCEVVVLCEPGTAPPDYTAIPRQGEFTLYYIQTRTFWSQISTIWEWFIANFSSDDLAARGHTRPVWVYDVLDNNWAGPVVIEGRMILDPGVIEFADRRIDRVTRQWQSAQDSLGFCQRLPLWDAIAVIDAATQNSTEAGQ